MFTPFIETLLVLFIKMYFERNVFMDFVHSATDVLE